MPAASTLSRRVEEASLNAWPAMHQVLLDGWLLRFSRGFTKRANSIIPLYPTLQGIEEKVRYCENLYAREQLQTIFRLTSTHDHSALEAYLDERGYASADQTHVMTTRLGAHTTRQLQAVVPATSIAFQQVPLQEWLVAYAALTSLPDQAQSLHGVLLRAIRTECAFGVISEDGAIVACGLGVFERDLLGLFDIVTHPEHRRAGLGLTLVSSLLNWGAELGAQHAYLQMVATNTAAAALYRKLGFTNLHDYWYRISG